MNNVLTLNSSVSHRIPYSSIKSSILKGEKLPQFYSYGLYFLSINIQPIKRVKKQGKHHPYIYGGGIKIPPINRAKKLKKKCKENNMFNSTVLFWGSESNVPTNSQTSYPLFEMNSFTERQNEKSSSGKLNPINNYKIIRKSRLKMRKISNRNTSVSQSNFLEFIKSWLNSKIKYIGAQLILQLINNPDEEMDVLELASHLPHHKSHTKTKYPVNQGIGEPFEMADWKTVNECEKKIEELKKDITADYELGLEEDARIKQEEVQKIISYLNEIRFGGRLRMFPNIRTMEYQRLFNAYNRILKLAENEDPEVARYFRNHIQTGKLFKWISDQVSNIDALD